MDGKWSVLGAEESRPPLRARGNLASVLSEEERRDRTLSLTVERRALERQWRLSRWNARQPRPPTRPQLPLRPGDAALWRRRPDGRPPAASHELLSSKHKSSSLADTARTAASGVMQPRDPCRRHRCSWCEAAEGLVLARSAWRWPPANALTTPPPWEEGVDAGTRVAAESDEGRRLISRSAGCRSP
jgi:hypothetical protein